MCAWASRTVTVRACMCGHIAGVVRRRHGGGRRGRRRNAGRWYNSTTMPEWVWKGDASSDEVCGHMFIYPIVHDILAETADEKQAGGPAARPLAQNA